MVTGLRDITLPRERKKTKMLQGFNMEGWHESKTQSRTAFFLWAVILKESTLEQVLKGRQRTSKQAQKFNAASMNGLVNLYCIYFMFCCHKEWWHHGGIVAV